MLRTLLLALVECTSMWPVQKDLLLALAVEPRCNGFIGGSGCMWLHSTVGALGSAPPQPTHPPS